MQFQDRPTHRTTWAAAITAALLVAAVAAFLATRGDHQPAGSLPPAPSPPPTAAAATTTTVEPRTEVVARLKEILRVRDRALLKRNAALLDEIYTVDCNCLQDGRSAIRRFRQEGVVWKGLTTRLTVQQIERIKDRLWTITGVLSTRQYESRTSRASSSAYFLRNAISCVSHWQSQSTLTSGC